MKTFNGFIRSSQASLRRLEKVQIELNKIQNIQANLKNVNSYNSYLDGLITIHENISKKIDWIELAARKAPIKPTMTNENEQEWRNKINTYNPSIFDKIFKLQERRKLNLNEKLICAIKEDKKKFQALLAIFNYNYDNWLKVNRLSKKILGGDIDAYNEAYQSFKPFDSIKNIGKKIFLISDKESAELTLIANEIKIIPTYVLTQTSTGKLSTKEFVVTKRNEFYKEHICSATFRVAREIFNLLPLKAIVINIALENPSKFNGRIEEQTILSVFFDSETFQKINYENISPSMAVLNFKHNINYSRLKGFDITQRLILKDGF
ncbi:MAG: hypothetical protein JST94_11080 [Bacteroidetes bacterium]|nr:hypothetical protein [Bacteroidota bacterium]MBS1671973.1 hypothetical protein [Bacteroidota bacterium]